MDGESLTLEAVSIGTLTDVDLTVAPGEIVCLSGLSGSGKSRLLRAVADLDPHDGSIRLGDRLQHDEPAHRWRRSVMLVPSESQWWHDTVGEHFVRPMPETLAELDFEPDVAEWPVARLSSGEKQRLALVRAVSVGPDALLLDEPTANLDDDNTARVESWLRHLIEERQLPTLWVAHNSAQIERVGNRHFRIHGHGLERVS